MNVIITEMRSMDFDTRIALAALEVQTEDGDLFNLIVSADTALTLLQPLMDSGAALDVPDWLLLPFPLFDPDD
jgi:hypothetical protein